MSEPTLRVQEIQAALDRELAIFRPRLANLLRDAERFSEPLPAALQSFVLLMFDAHCVRFLAQCREKAGDA